LNVFAMLRKVFVVTDSMVRKTRLPNGQTRFQAERESPLDELDSPFQRYLKRRSDQRVKVIGHDDKFMKEILALIAVAEKDIDKQVGSVGSLK
jgi:hypothetical protein